MSNTEEIDEFGLGADTVSSIIKMPDKFHFDKKEKIFYEITPFGDKIFKHAPVLKFFGKLNEKYGTRDNFLDMIYDLTEFRLADPHFYVDIHNRVMNKTAGEALENNFNEIKIKYASNNPNIVKEIYDLAAEVTGMKLEVSMKLEVTPGMVRGLLLAS